MKNFRSKICKLMSLMLVSLMLAAVTVFSVSGCGKVVEEIDSNKTQLYIEYYSGGLGSSWLDAAEADFEAKYNDIQVIITKTDKATSMQVQDLQSQKPSAQIYYGVDSIYYQAINNGDVADLTDILDRKPDGDTGLTVKEKILDFDLWSRAGSKINSEGIYMLPHSDSFFGQVFDYDTFVENGWIEFAANTEQVKNELTAQGITFEVDAITDRLIFKSSTNVTNYEDGDYIAACGKDLKYGTYDDGQPQTWAEYMALLETIKNSGWKGFIWTKKYSPFYSQPVSAAMLYQLLGEDGLKTYKKFNGSFVDTLGTFGEVGATITVTPETGYKVYQMPEVKQTIQYAKDTYMNSAYYNEDSLNTDTDHKAAQNKFLLSYKKDDPEEGKFIKPTAFLFEGSWWENEAKPTFQMIAEEGQVGRGYGERDYRYMFIPKMPGQKGTQYYIIGQGCGGMVVSSKQSAELLKISKDFIVFSLQDKYLKMAQLDTGVPKPYKTNMTEEDYKKLTPFGRFLSEMVNDTKNVRIYRDSVEFYTEPMNYLSGKPDNGTFVTKVTSGANAGVYTALDTGLERLTVDEFFNGIAENYSPEAWAGYYNLVREYYE